MIKDEHPFSEPMNAWTLETEKPITLQTPILRIEKFKKRKQLKRDPYVNKVTRSEIQSRFLLNSIKVRLPKKHS